MDEITLDQIEQLRLTALRRANYIAWLITKLRMDQDCPAVRQAAADELESLLEGDQE